MSFCFDGLSKVSSSNLFPVRNKIRWWKACAAVSVYCCGKKCNILLNSDQSKLPPPTPRTLQPTSFPLFWLIWHKKEKLNISFGLICGFICRLLSVVMARTIQSFSRRFFFSFLNPISPSLTQDQMCFHWRELSYHSTPVAFKNPSEWLTCREDFSANPFTETPQCPLLVTTLFTTRIKASHDVSEAWSHSGVSTFIWPRWQRPF